MRKCPSYDGVYEGQGPCWTCQGVPEQCPLFWEEEMSGCEFHVGQFDRTCCSGKWGLDKYNREDGYIITNYFQQAALAADIMNAWAEENSEYREEWEAWDWL